MKAKKLLEDLYGSRVGRLKSFGPGQEPAYTTEQEQENDPQGAIREMVASIVDVYRDLDLYLKDEEDTERRIKIAEIRNKLMNPIKKGRSIVGY
jgi:hypothetical protein